MLIPLLLLGLGLYYFFAWAVMDIVKPDNPKKIWKYFLFFAVFVCTADHVFGYLYARIWLELAQGESNKVVVTDSIALHQTTFDLSFMGPISTNKMINAKGEDSVISYASTMVNMHSDSKKRDGYSVIQALAPTYQWPIKDFSVYELRISSNANDPRCRAFFMEDKTRSAQWHVDWRARWRKAAAENLDGGDTAQCVAAQQIPRITANYLKQDTIYNVTPVQQLLGLGYPMVSQKILEVSTGKVLGECRFVEFSGGWIQRKIIVGLEGNHFSKSLESSSGCPEYIPKTRQRITK